MDTSSVWLLETVFHFVKQGLNGTLLKMLQYLEDWVNRSPCSKLSHHGLVQTAGTFHFCLKRKKKLVFHCSNPFKDTAFFK